MRQIKIYKIDDLTKSDHPNVNKVFPLQDNNLNEDEILNDKPIAHENSKVNTKVKVPLPTRQYNLRSKNKPKELMINAIWNE